MPKSTHFHQAHDAMSTDKKFRPDDEGITQREKQEFQGSETDKKATPKSEKEFIADQDERTQTDQGERNEE